MKKAAGIPSANEASKGKPGEGVAGQAAKLKDEAKGKAKDAEERLLDVHDM